MKGDETKLITFYLEKGKNNKNNEISCFNTPHRGINTTADYTQSK